MLWIHGRGIRPQFAWKGESQGVSQVAAGSVGSFELPRGPEGASHVGAGLVELRRETQRSSSGSDWDLGVPMEILVLGHGIPLPSRGGKGVSGLLSS